MVTVRGKIIFSGGPPDSIPDNSTLTVKFQDTNRMDVAAINLGHYTSTIQGYQKGTELKFEIVGAKRPEHGLGASISATINIGWAPSGDEWIRRGDYLNDTNHPIKMSDNINEYNNCDVTVIHYR